MALYMLQGTYTAEAWAAQIKKPQNRIEVVRPAFEKLGGKIQHTWFSFGEYDVTVVADFPDAVSAAAISIAIAAGGAFSQSKTTVLMSIEDGLEAVKKAAGTGYKAPGR